MARAVLALPPPQGKRGACLQGDHGGFDLVSLPSLGLRAVGLIPSWGFWKPGCSPGTSTGEGSAGRCPPRGRQGQTICESFRWTRQEARWGESESRSTGLPPTRVPQDGDRAPAEWARVEGRGKGSQLEEKATCVSGKTDVSAPSKGLRKTHEGRSWLYRPPGCTQ